MKASSRSFGTGFDRSLLAPARPLWCQVWPGLGLNCVTTRFHRTPRTSSRSGRSNRRLGERSRLLSSADEPEKPGRHPTTKRNEGEDTGEEDCTEERPR